MTTTDSKAIILVASDSHTDAALVRGVLTQEFDHVYTSCDPAQAGADFTRHLPDVVVLAFNALEKSERYHLNLYRHYGEVYSHPHRTVVLCNKDEMKNAYDLCMKDLFDDYVLFWPMTYDSSRLNMSVHFALRELAKLSDSAATAPLQKKHLEAASPVKEQRPTILIVDDDTFQHKLVGRILKDCNYQLLFAVDGVEVLNIVRKTRPDLVLMDVMMPDMDGIETTRHLKANPQFAKIPVIMITGKSEGQVVIDSLKAGAIDFVVKPFDGATLIAKIARALTAKG
jgi:CheY-like chemotaxis protein